MENYTKYNKDKIIENIEKLKIVKEKLEASDDYLNNLLLISLIDQSFNFLIDILDEDYTESHPFSPEGPKMSKCLESDLLVMKEKKIYIPTVSSFLLTGYEEFIDTPFFKDYLDIEDEQDTTYTNKEIMEFVHDFYRTIPDREIRLAFLNNFREKHNNFRFQGGCSNTMFLPSINYPYINVSEETSNAKKFINSVHEYGHAINDSIYPRFLSYDNEYPYIELMSMTLEQLGADYFKRINPNHQGITRKEQLDYYYTLLCFAETLIMEKDAFTKGFKNIKQCERYLKKQYGDEADKVLIYPALQSFSYLIPFSISIELVHMYETDPEYAMHILKQLIKCEYNYLESLDDYDIHPSEHMKEYVEKIKTLSK